jgi:hypothetical protein
MCGAAPAPSRSGQRRPASLIIVAFTRVDVLLILAGAGALGLATLLHVS